MGSSGGTQTVQNVPSPEQSQAFQFRMGQAQAGLAPFGEQQSGWFTNPANSPYQLTPEMRQAITGIQQAAMNGPAHPTENWAMQAYQPGAQQLWNTASAGPNTQQWQRGAEDLMSGWTGGAGQLLGQWNAGADRLANYVTGTNPATMNGWLDFAQAGGEMAASPISVGGANYGAADIDYTAQGSTYNPVDVGTMAPVSVDDIDPEAAIGAARNTLQTISSPAIRNALQAGGLGRSGAEAEALAQEGVRLELPIQQQILQHQSDARKLEATIQANQEQVQFLEVQKARLQAQALTAQSADAAMAINGQIAGIEAQIKGRLAEAELAAQTQAAIAQRTSALNYASNSLGQLAGMNMGQYQTVAQTGANLLGQLNQTGTNLLGQYGQLGSGLLGQQMGANIAGYQGAIGTGNNIANNLATMGLQIPNLENQHYLSNLQGNQALLQAASLPQQMNAANFQNAQNYILSLLGASPLPSQIGGGTQTVQQNPGVLNYLGTAALLGSNFMGQ